MNILRNFSAAAIFIVCSSHTFADQPARVFYGELDSPCHPAFHITCGLPYPSDIYTHEDNTSETGIGANFPTGIISEELFEEIPTSLTPEIVYNGSNGFSAATSVLFELPKAPDPTTVPADGGDTVVAFNLDTGERVPILVQYSDYARSIYVLRPSHIIEIYARSRWKFSNRYVVAVTNNLRTASGGSHIPSAGFIDGIANSGSRLSNYYGPTLDFLENQGIDRDDLIDLTFFTVRSENDVTGRITKLTDYVYNADHPVRNMIVTYPWTGNVAAHVRGDLWVHNFRNSDGGVYYDLDEVKGHWIRFHLALPWVAKYKQVPISIYGHGLGAMKEADSGVVASNAKLGIATVSIDHPNHGTRILADGGYVMAMVSPSDAAMLSGIAAQSTIDFMSLLKAIRTSIGAIDVLPKRSWSTFISTPAYNGDGIAEIDTSNIFYQGTSLGGVLGSTFIALAPDLKGAFLQVTGVGFSNMLSNSMIWEGYFSHLMPRKASGAEAMLMKSALQHEGDYADAINFIHYFRNPPNTTTAKPVAVVIGEGDSVVPNFTSAAMAEIAQLPQVGPILFPIDGVDQVDHLDEGYGIYQVPPVIDIQGPLRGLFAHMSFTGDKAQAIMNDWIKEVILEQ